MKKKVHWERPKLFLEVNFSVEKWAKTFVFDAILKLKTDEERSLGAPIFFLEVNFFSPKMALKLLFPSWSSGDCSGLMALPAGCSVQMALPLIGDQTA